jgi:chemotaxis protein MotB
MKKLKEDLQKALQKNPELKKFLQHIDIQITAEGLRIEFLEDKSDFFELGKSDLKAGALKVIHALAPSLIASRRPMKIEGHTDSTAFAGDRLRNFKLSGDRAESLLAALDREGVPFDKFRGASALADTELRDPQHPTSGINRRVSILLPFGAKRDSKVPLPLDEVKATMKEGATPTVQLSPLKPDLVPPLK